MLRKLLKAGVVYAILALGALSSRACFGLPGAGYWHTSGSTILDSNNQVVRIAGINWYGFETTDEVAHGLTSQDYKTILQTILANGYNTVRLPFSNQMVETPIVPASISFTGASGPINTDLQGLNSLEIMDAIVGYAGQIGLRIILDDHRSEAGNSAEVSGLWYTEAYPESSWIADWQALVTRYQNDTAVIGVDLRNEPHNAASGGACWDCSTLTNDWHLAAERAGNAVLTINPKLLIFVEGTDEYNGNYTFWGGNLQGVQNSPVKLNVAGQLVYSAHDYGPAVSSQVWFTSSTDYNSLVSAWTSNWAYISLNGIAPVWLGELGTLNDDADIQSSASGSEGQWFSSLLQFLGANSALSWTYWALNGEDVFALLDANYDATPVSALKQQLLTSIQFPLSGGIPFMLPSLTLAQNPSTVLAASSNNDLGGSSDTTEVTYTAVVNNRSSGDLVGPTIDLALPAAAVAISEASTGSPATCRTIGANYSCSFNSIPASSSGGVTVTAIYPSANLTFNANGQALEVVTATETIATYTLPAVTVATTIDRQSTVQNQTETILANPLPGYSLTYGQQTTVNFTLVPTPSTPIPITSFSAQLDGTQSLTITSIGSNQYQIPVGLLSGGSHAVAIHLASSPSYAAATTTVALAVQKAQVTEAVAGAPVAGNYGASIPVTLDLTGAHGNGFAAPTGRVSLVVDNLAPVNVSLSGATASFNAPAGLSANTHSMNLTYSGDGNYAAQNLNATLVVKQVPLVAAALSATRAYGAPNPVFSGSLTGVVTGDGITATYISQATATTTPGTYATAPYAIAPVLADPNNRLPNYVVTLEDGALTISGQANTITFPQIQTQVYGNPPVALAATGIPGQPVTFSLVSGPAVLSNNQLQLTGAGTVTVTASQAASQGYPAASATQSFVVGRAPLTVIVQNATRGPNQVNPPFSGTVTGFIKGDTATSTRLTYSTTAILGSAPGSYPITASLGNATAVANYALSVTPGTLTISDFSLSANPATLSLIPGESGTLTLSVVSSTGFNQALTLACSGLPAGSTCTFLPASIPAGGTNGTQSTTVTIALPAASTAAVRASGDNGRYLAGFFVLPGGLLGFYLWWQRRRLQRSMGIWILATIFVLSVVIGCSGSVSQIYSNSFNAVITATAPDATHTLTIPVTLTQ